MKAQEIALRRAIDMLHVAGEMVEVYAADRLAIYEGMNTTGDQVTVDCQAAAEELEIAFAILLEQAQGRIM